MVSLLGSAGTGKTYLTVEIVKKLIESKISCAITAPTHKAAGVIGQLLLKNNINKTPKTIHSFLGIKAFIDYKTGVESFVVDKKAKRTAVDVLIVDESSMVNAELFELIQESLEENWARFVLFVGDSNQLLPVSGSSNMIFELKNQYKLTQIIRQAKGSYIIDIANKIKNILETKKYIPLDDFFAENIYNEIEYFNNEQDFVDDFYGRADWFGENKILATHKNSDVDAFNRQIRNEYWIQKGVLKPEQLRQGDTLRFIDAYTVNDVNIYHNGQEIMLDYAIKKYHDSLGIYYWECKSVNTIDQQIFRVVDPISTKHFNDKLQFLSNKAKRTPFPERQAIWKMFYEVRNMFANVQYIYSSTIHKLQGSTYEVCYINAYDLVTNFNMSLDEKYRLLYVAITRASKDIKIFLPGNKQAKSNEMDTISILNEIDEQLNRYFK
jgi:ATP-dependent exoDNAse (exonuclease V) alpha subunit